VPASTASGQVNDDQLAEANDRRITAKQSGDKDLDFTSRTDDLRVTWTGLFDKISGIATVDFGILPGDLCDVWPRTKVITQAHRP